MAQEQPEYRDISKFIREQADTISSEESGVTEKSEKLHRIAVLPFRDLLNDPVGPLPVINLLHPERLQPANDALIAIGVHSAGEYLPSGRHSVVYVNKQSLSESARRRATNGDKNYEFFLDLFNKVYRQIFGRQYTLIHTLLHSAQKDGALIEIPLEANGGNSHQEPSISDADKVTRLNLDGVLESLLDKAVLDKFVQTLWGFTPLVSREQAPVLNTQLTDHYSSKIATLLRTERNPEKTWYCFFHTFNRNVQRASTLLEDKLVSDRDFINRLITVIFGEAPADQDEHTIPIRLRQAATMLQLFFLYREICGKWFYVIVPKQQQHLSMCFTVGSDRRLTSEELSRLRDLAGIIRNELQYDLKHAHEKYIDRRGLQFEWEALKTLISPATATALSKKDINRNSYGARLGGGLPLYLKFCERISELAMHEGKKLHFDIVVSGGMFASEMLSKVSNFCPNGSKPWSVLVDNDDLKSPVNMKVISQLIGNYEFMQEKGVVLFGSRDGHLLYLAKMLDPQQNPEVFTEGGNCYLLQVRVNGDIHMFYKGELALWRRAGQYIVPEAYGAEYRNRLSGWLSTNFTSLHVNYDALAEVIWSLSSDGRGGGSFVLGHMDQGSFKLRTHTYALSEVFPYAEGLPLVDTGSTELLKRLAVQDGAVVIDIDTGRVFGRRQLLPNMPFDWHQHKPQWESEGELKWEDWHKVLRWGTRHHSALAFSAASSSVASSRSRTAAAAGSRRPRPAAAVITVSSDGEIHVFYGPRPEPTLTYPQQSLSTR